MTPFLKDHNLPLSPSLGSMIDSMGSDYIENWDEKVFVRFHNENRTDQSIDDNWKVLFNFCDKKKLNEFILKFTSQLVHISKLESDITDYNGNDYHRYRIYDLIDPIIEDISKEYMKCIDPKKFSQN